jgi:phage shock protein PspC (stress-responsive transcriptional regulator)
MNTVIIVNLNGIAFHLEEPGFLALRTYLERAQTQLKDNPDRAEIIADLEQAIADKCAHFLSPHKNVLSAAEIAEVLRQMGPVESDSAADAGAGTADAAGAGASAAASGAPRRLYRIRDGAMLSGVCNGLAAYFNVDAVLVRIIFLLLAVFSGGLFILVYIAMILVIPRANTDEERAAAAGAPFNAQDVIDRAKKYYGEFADGRDWRRHWRQQRHEWRRQRREWRHRWRHEARWWAYNFERMPAAAVPAAGYAGQVVAGLMIPILAVARTLLFCALLVAIASLATNEAIFGWPVTGSMPLWVAVLLLLVVYSILASPLKYSQRALYIHTGGHAFHWFAAWDGLLSLGVLVLVGCVAYSHLSPVHDFLQHLPENLRTMWDNFVHSFHHPAKAAPQSRSWGVN